MSTQLDHCNVLSAFLAIAEERSFTTARHTSGYPFKSWRTTLTCMCGLCERPPMTDASRRHSARGRTRAT